MQQHQTDEHANGKNTKRAMLVVFIVMATAVVVRGDVTDLTEPTPHAHQTDLSD